MARPIQPDLFAEMERPRANPAGLTPPEPPLPPYEPDLDDVRRRLARILGEARAAETLPWNEDRLAVFRAIVPHMTGWLPEEEGARLRFEFETELARLQAACARLCSTRRIWSSACRGRYRATPTATPPPDGRR